VIGRRFAVRATIAALLVVGAAAGWPPSPAVADPGDIGVEGPSSAGDGSGATGEKPQSKLWWNDGSWWSVLFDVRSQTHHVFRLDRATGQWLDTGTMVDNRPKTRSDVLWDGTRLYVASHVRASSSTGSASGNPARLYRLSYDPVTRTYSRDAGFPVAIGNHSTEALTLDRDSTGTLWATWTQNTRVYVNNTVGSDAAWGVPFVPALAGITSLDADDISAVVTFAGRTGVMWSNQNTSAMYFAMHTDGADRTDWQPSRTAIQGPKSSDDHISLKSLQTDPEGRVFAAIKTGLDEAGGSSSAPQILMLARDPSTGDWQSAPVGRISDCHTRPIVVVDAAERKLHVFATAPESGCPFTGTPGTIFMKSSALDDLSFPLGRGTPVMRDASSANLNNATSTKQSVDATTGLVVLASNDATQRYWHADLPVGPA
jgi:hypothetical protein